MILLTFLLLLPGALTGAGSVTVLITGGMVAVVLETMGVSRVRTAAIVFIIAGLSAAAPPVSLWAMMTAAGVNMPYVGFFWPLLLPCVFLSLVTIFLLGGRVRPSTWRRLWRSFREPPEGMGWGKVFLPLLVFGALIFIGRQWPHDTPVLGLPFMFGCAAATSFLLSPVRLDFLKISRETIKQLLPLIGTLTCVGVLVQIMTLTGVRGLLAVTAVTLPVGLGVRHPVPGPARFRSRVDVGCRAGSGGSPGSSLQQHRSGSHRGAGGDEHDLAPGGRSAPDGHHRSPHGGRGRVTRRVTPDS